MQQDAKQANLGPKVDTLVGEKAQVFILVYSCNVLDLGVQFEQRTSDPRLVSTGAASRVLGLIDPPVGDHFSGHSLQSYNLCLARLLRKQTRTDQCLAEPAKLRVRVRRKNHL